MRTLLHAATVLSGIFFLTACGSDFEDTAPGEPGAPGSGGSGASAGSDAAAGASGSTAPDGPGGGAGGTVEGSAGQGDDTDAGVPEVDASGPDAQESDADPDSATPDAAPDQDPSCPTGWADCDEDPANGCEINVTGDPDHCGACGHACGGAHASATCEQGACVLSCDAGFDDCDGVAANGCEADLSTTENCLACGVVCGGGAHATATCGASGCGHTCVAGWDDCDSNPANGCEVPLQTDANHCGACGQACPTRANASPSCEAGNCGFTCLANFEDCDGQVGNGCEANLQTSTSHCGGCGKTCGTAHGAASCTGGACSIACHVDWADCDGVNANGCETSTATTANCGACGNVCGEANGWASCGAGACQISCKPGFADCDGVNANGCEVDVNTNANHCGQCGRSCLGATCVDGLCVPQVVTTANDFTIRDGVLYTAFGHKLSKVSALGTMWSTKVLYEGDGAIWDPVGPDGRAYFFDGYPNSRLRAVSTGTMPVISTIVSTIAGYPAALAYSDGMVYWRSLDVLFKADVTKTNAQGTSLAAIPTDVEELHVQSGSVCWVSQAQGRIACVSTAGGNVAQLFGDQSQPADMVVEPTGLYWVNRGSGQVRRGNTVLATGLGALRSITADGDYLYVSNNSQIFRVRKDGGEELLLMDTVWVEPDDLVVDGSWLYWIVRGNTERVYRVAK